MTIDSLVEWIELNGYDLNEARRMRMTFQQKLQRMFRGMIAESSKEGFYYTMDRYYGLNSDDVDMCVGYIEKKLNVRF